METENGKTTESAMPAANKYGYQESHTGMPQRRIEEMKRKIFIKQLMALGLERNKANSFCKQMLARLTKEITGYENEG